MMRTKFRDRQSGRDPATTDTIGNSSGFLMTTVGHQMETDINSTINRTQKDAGPRVELLTRLAAGKRANVDLQAMKRRTRGNYEKLPEILKKKEEAKKQEDLLEKKARAAAYQKELDARLRSGMKKRKDKEEKDKDLYKRQ